MSRSLPHGLYSLLLVFLAASGWFASLWQGDGCNYAIVTGPIVDQLERSLYSTNNANANSNLNSNADGSANLNTNTNANANLNTNANNANLNTNAISNPITTLELGFDSYRELPNLVSIDLATEPPIGGDGISNDYYNNATSSSSIFTNITSSVSNVTDSYLRPWSADARSHHKPKASCIDYPEEVTLGIVDTSWTTSRSFAFFGLVLGGTGTSFLCCSLCFVFSKVTWRWTGYGLLLAALCQALSLVAWFSTQLCSWNSCGWSLGSVSDLVALWVWALTGLMVVCHYPVSVSDEARSVSVAVSVAVSAKGGTQTQRTARTRTRMRMRRTVSKQHLHQKLSQDHDDENEDEPTVVIEHELRRQGSGESQDTYDDVDIDGDGDVNININGENRRYPLAEIA